MVPSDTERRARENSYQAMASDSEDGAVSDGDPPFLAGPSSLASTSTAAGGGSPFPSSARSTNPDSLSGATGGANAVTVGTGHAVASGGAKKSKRSFEELEDIVFSNPKSFASLAFAIAESRGVTLVVSDDRTHKVTSAYMHITCAYRKAGCPFILKLTKAKDGGWILKGAKALEAGRAIDIKQRSIYRCRHPAGATAEIPTGPSAAFSAGLTTSYPVSSNGDGVSRPKAARGARASASGPSGGEYGALEQNESLVGKIIKGSTSRPRASAPLAPVYGTASGFATPSSSRAPVSTTNPPASAERALAPPFQRSLDLQSRIVPVLNANGFSAPKGSSFAASGSRGGGDHPTAMMGSPKAGFAPPLGSASYDLEIIRPHGRSADEGIPSALSTVPVVARADPSALPDWTRLLKLLSPSVIEQTSSASSPASSATAPNPPPPSSAASYAPSLVPLARVLSHAYMSITPTQFFSPSTTVEMRTEVLDALPVERVGVWNKVWAKKVLLSADAAAKWAQVEKDKRDELDEDVEAKRVREEDDAEEAAAAEDDEDDKMHEDETDAGGERDGDLDVDEALQASRATSVAASEANGKVHAKQASAASSGPPPAAVAKAAACSAPTAGSSKAKAESEDGNDDDQGEDDADDGHKDDDEDEDDKGRVGCHHVPEAPEWTSDDDRRAAEASWAEVVANDAHHGYVFS
ncbi:hypothetical protein JCM10212_006126 [Sporobolomyces blumeae]